MCLACKDNLYRHVRPVDNIDQPFCIGQNQVRAFVSGKATGKSNGERVRVDQYARRNHLYRMEAALTPSVAHSLTHIKCKLAFKMLTYIPYFGIRDLIKLIPNGMVIE